MTVKTEYDPTQGFYRFSCSTHGIFTVSAEVQEALKTATVKRGSVTLPPILPNCPKCREEKQRAEDENKRMTAIITARKNCQLPRRFTYRDLDSWVVNQNKGGGGQRQKVKSIAERYVENFESVSKEGICMIFAGHPGTGKTHLAAGVMIGIINQGFTAVYTTGLDMKAFVQATYRDEKGSLSRAQAISSFIGPNLLVIDEIDLMHASEDAQLILWQVISGRYNEGNKPTIVISNLSREELSNQLGDRIIDRLREGGGRFVVFDWKSYRR